MNVGFSWAVIDRIPNLFDPTQSVRSQQPTETGDFRGLTSFWMKIEVKRNQVRLRYLSEILSEILSEKEKGTAEQSSPFLSPDFYGTFPDFYMTFKLFGISEQFTKSTLDEMPKVLFAYGG